MDLPTIKSLRILSFIQIFFLLSECCCVSSFGPSSSSRFRKRNNPPLRNNPASREVAGMTEQMTARLDEIPRSLLIHWKGEDGDSFGSHFRQTELKGALAAVLCRRFDDVSLDLSNALQYTGDDLINKPPKNIASFNSALQYLNNPQYTRRAYILAVQRCSLAHALYEIDAEADDFQQLADSALTSHGFDDMKRGNENEHLSWCVRVRHFGESSGSKQDLLRYGGRTRSVTKEKEVCLALKNLLLQFGGQVDLKQPDVKIYVFDGLFRDSERVVLTRRLADGPQISGLDPNTRICITNTPLVPTAAYLLCNAACLHKDATVLDPYAGSATILLAAAMVAPSCRTVGIEIAHDGLVKREHIRQDFAVRQLTAPLGLLQGDSTDASIRSAARQLIGDDAFDCILSDPPYGIRESTIEMDPISCLVESIASDRERGKPLLKVGGMLVCFVPCHDEQTLEDVLPTAEQLSRARLRLCASHEQPLNKKLSRWLVSYVCEE